MPYLDVAPMITALRVAPQEFALETSRHAGDLLVHKPSKHKFMSPFDLPMITGTECDCSMLRIQYGQEDRLAKAAREWHATYWVPKLAQEKAWADEIRAAHADMAAARARQWAWIKSRPAAALATVRAWFKPATATPPCHDILRRVEAGGDD